MAIQTNIVPLRPNRAVKTTGNIPVIDLGARGLPTEHPVGSYLASLGSRSSRETMMAALAAALAAQDGKRLGDCTGPESRFYYQEVWRVEWHKIRNPWMTALNMALQQVKYSASQRAKCMTAVRRVLSKCRTLKLMTAEAYFDAVDDLPKISRNSPPHGRLVGIDEIRCLINACESDPLASGVRDAAIIGLGWKCGFRRCEVVGLRMKDYAAGRGLLTVFESKGGATREVPINGAAQRCLDDWIALRGDLPGPVFVRVIMNGDIFIRDHQNGGLRRMMPIVKPSSINRILNKRIAQAGLLEPFGFHDLRKTAATEITKISDLEVARRLLGHKSVETTARYRLLDDDEVRDAVAQRQFPYRGRR